MKLKFTDEDFIRLYSWNLNDGGMAKALNILKSTVKLRRRRLFLVEVTVLSVLLLTTSIINPSSCKGSEEYVWASVTAELHFGTSLIYHKGEWVEVPGYGIELHTGMYFPIDSEKSLYELFSPEFDEKGILYKVSGFPDIAVNVFAPSETKLEDVYVSIYITALRRIEIKYIALIILDDCGFPIGEYPLYAGIELGPLSWNDKPYVISKLLALPVKKWGYGIYNYAVECYYEFKSFNLTLLGYRFRQAYLNLYGEEPHPTGYFRLCIPLKTTVVEVPMKELEQKYNALETEYGKLKSDFESLKIDYNDVKVAYDRLESDYESLKQAYEDLQMSYDSLKSKYELTRLELNTTRLLMYSFIATTIAFAVATIYFVKRKPKAT
jgi:hypothetical protein